MVGWLNDCRDRENKGKGILTPRDLLQQEGGFMRTTKKPKMVELPFINASLFLSSCVVLVYYYADRFQCFVCLWGGTTT